jgi:uncharacterized protein YjiS (DUF1127 family)
MSRFRMLRRVKYCIAAFRAQSVSSAGLESLSDRTLQDIGATRKDERHLQHTPPFWIPGIF